MSEVIPRVSGTETEFATSVRHVGNTHHEPFVPHDNFIRDNLPSELEESDYMLSNGSRYYRDYQLLEYATPEELSFHESVRREFAGERIVIDCLANYMRGNPDVASMYLRKRVIDDYCDSSGYHINLSADRRAIPNLYDEYMHLIGLHIATSQPFLGAGAVLAPGTKYARYSYGQKVLSLMTDYSLKTNRPEFKPLINLRDEPLNISRDTRRIHLTSLDPHISPWAAEMTLGTCSLVLRAIEQGYKDDVRIANNRPNAMVELAKSAATNLSGDGIVMLRGSTEKSITLNDLRENIIETVSKTEHTPEEAQILTRWIQAHEDFSTDPTLLADRSDAIARLEMIRKWNRAVGNDADDMSTDVARAADSMYDRIFEHGTKLIPAILSVDDARKRSYPDRIRNGAMQALQPSEAEIMDAYYNAPSTTRAFGRGRDIATGNVTKALWTEYLYSGEMISTNNPREPDARKATS